MSEGFCDRLSYHDKKGNFVAVECKKHACNRYQLVEGKHPQTGVEFAEYDCAYNWTNILLIENTQRQMQTAKAVTALKNETVGSQKELVKLLISPMSIGQQ